jgi:DNA modification methylase
MHPTQKPVELLRRAITNSSNPGDVVLDVFGGSGSTTLACETMNRACYSLERDPRFVDVAIQRWQEATGKKALKIEVKEEAVS